MRDLSLAHVLPEWLRTGVASIKIEGRMKNALYVAAIVDFYRRKLDGRLDGAAEQEAARDIQTIFSRPWTTLYTQGPDAAPETIIDAAAIGHRGVQVGNVSGVAVDREGRRWLRFVTARALEKHDGLQVEPVGGGVPVGFGIGAMRRAGAARLEVALPAGADLEVLLPVDAPQAIEPGMTVFCTASQAVRRRYPVKLPREGGLRTSHPADIRVTLAPGAISVCATAVPDGACGTPVSITVSRPMELTAARTPEGSLAALHKAFDRSGDTRWRVRQLERDDPHGLYAPPSRLNELRRAALDALTQAHAAAQAARLRTLSEALGYGREFVAARHAGAPRWALKVRLETGPFAGAGEADEVVVSIGLHAADAVRAALAAWERLLPRARLRLALPLIVRGEHADALEATVDALLADGCMRWECAGLAGAQLLRSRMGRYPALELVADWSCYGMNRVARAQWAEFGMARAVASPEESRANMRALAPFPPLPEALVFQHTPLFISATAPHAAATAGGGSGEWAFEDRRGRHLIVRRYDGQVVTVAQSPFCLADRADELAALGIGWMRADFSWSPGRADACARWWQEIRSGRLPPGSHAGNYLRGLS